MPRKPNAKPNAEDSGENIQASAEVVEMNAYAQRIFDGQSDHVPLIERVSRLKAACEARGYGAIFGQLELNTSADYKRYL